LRSETADAAAPSARLAGGVIAFGMIEEELVQKYSASQPEANESVGCQVQPVAAAQPPKPHPEGEVSSTMVNRGDRI
jgi:hypothetical protein